MRSLVCFMAALALAACHREPAAAPQPPAAPFAFAQKNEAAEVSMTLPDGVRLYPKLHLKLYNDGRRELSNFVTHAVQNRTRTDAAEFRAPYFRKSVWTLTVDTPRLVSLTESWSDYTGGSHPNNGTSVVLWDKVLEAAVRRSELFRADADYAALDAVLCEAARVARVKRLGAQTAGGDAWSCPRWRSAEAGLAPSTVPGKAGGLIFYFDPYVLGAYAQGDYRVVIPLARFAPSLSPTYAGQFAGAPAGVLHAQGR